jgi:hypothetical protein
VALLPGRGGRQDRDLRNPLGLRGTSHGRSSEKDHVARSVGTTFHADRHKPPRAGPLASFEVFGPLRAELERQAGEGFSRGIAVKPRPLLFGDPGSGFYPRLPLRRRRDGVLGFREGASRFHNPILAQDASPRSGGRVPPVRGIIRFFCTARLRSFPVLYIRESLGIGPVPEGLPRRQRKQSSGKNPFHALGSIQYGREPTSG